MDTKQTVVNETSAKIAAINDKHRRNMEGCTVTRGIVAMRDDAKEIFVKVRDFSDLLKTMIRTASMTLAPLR